MRMTLAGFRTAGHFASGVGSLTTRNQTGLVANFSKRNRKLVREIQRIVAFRGYEVYALAYGNTPVDTGFMRDHLQIRFGPKGQVFVVGWFESDFESAGLPFYPLYVVFGTVHMPARDPLFPAHAAVRPEFLSDVRAAFKAFAA